MNTVLGHAFLDAQADMTRDLAAALAQLRAVLAPVFGPVRIQLLVAAESVRQADPQDIWCPDRNLDPELSKLGRIAVIGEAARTSGARAVPLRCGSDKGIGALVLGDLAGDQRPPWAPVRQSLLALRGRRHGARRRRSACRGGSGAMNSTLPGERAGFARPDGALPVQSAAVFGKPGLGRVRMGAAFNPSHADDYATGFELADAALYGPSGCGGVPRPSMIPTGVSALIPRR